LRKEQHDNDPITADFKFVSPGKSKPPLDQKIVT